MYQGVVKDEARRAKKMKERQEEFLISQMKRERYEAVQSVLKKPDEEAGASS